MTIFDLPPQSMTNDHAIAEITKVIVDLDNSINKAFGSSFEERYRDHFKWFKDSIGLIETILNVGCSYGRETLALFLTFMPYYALGIDSDLHSASGTNPFTRIMMTQGISQNIGKLVNNLEKCRSVPSPLPNEIRLWYENSIPRHMRQGANIKYYPADITRRESIRIADGYFDLIYSRFVTDKIFNDGGESLLLRAIGNMRLMVKPVDGTIVIVDPSRSLVKSDASYDLGSLISEAGLNLIDKVPANQLGFIEVDDAELCGYLCRRPVE